MLDQMKALAGKKSICVLATVAGNKPYCSLMAYVSDEHCREIYMVTHRGTKKYQNLIQNPAVSLLIDTREELERTQAQALTVQGVFQKIHDPNKRILVRSQLLAVHPHLKDFADHPDAEFLCIKIESFLLLTGLNQAHFEVLPA
jgi:nitroimidazol reductase NimA-like FMN-containing flavoprotein (pyridoxamine 5'-phosphate oxidase superfamily)